MDIVKAILAIFGILILMAILQNTAEAPFRKHMGEEFILDKDTLTIVGYSSMFGTYDLSNGATIDMSLIKK